MHEHHFSACGAHAGLWDWNLASNRVHFSPRWLSMVGCDEHEVGDTPEAWLQRVHPDDLGQVRRELDDHLKDGPAEFDIPHRLLHKDGTYRWTSCHGVVVRNESGQAVRVTGCHSDVTADKVADELTGLPNRVLFLDHLARAIERTRRNPAHHFAVLLLDLDRPERHAEHACAAAGDPLLSAAARRLETCLRAGDSAASRCRDHLVARLRGDEFAILLDGLEELADARAVADRVLSETLASFTLRGGDVFLSASIGIAVSATGYTRDEDVLRDADTALYRAKSLGRARSEVFDTAILRSAQAQLQLEADFRDALTRREFLLYFQPVVSLASNQIAGFEALVRWQHPSRGLVSPAEFIPIAEKTGLIVPLGRWIVREACVQLKAWQETLPAAKDVWVSVNLSAPQFTQPALVDEIGDVLRDVGLPAHCLVLELTEGVAMENPSSVKGLLMRLRAMGARIALDDFGTGQSSLAYLHQFPADLLKLDRSFVRDMEGRKDMRDIVRAVTALAHQLGMHVIAEGAENDEQLALVRTLGCEYVQGFIYSRPVDKERAAQLMRTGFPPRPEIEPPTVPAPEAEYRQPVPVREPVNSRPRTRRPLYVAAAALVTLMLAGVAAWFAGAPPLPADTAPQSAAERGAPAPPPPLAAAPDRVSTSGSEQANTPAANAAPAAAAPIARAPATVSPVTKPVTYAFPVVHKRTLRDRRGQLTVSRIGIAFVPDKEKDAAKDGFTLKYNEFLYSLSDDELTIKSAAKTYRFKAAGAVGKDDNRARLQEVGDRIARLRRTPPAR